MTIELRRPQPEHIAELGRICYEAFKDIAESHGFPPDFDSVEFAQGVVGLLMQQETVYSDRGVRWRCAARIELPQHVGRRRRHRPDLRRPHSAGRRHRQETHAGRARAREAAGHRVGAALPGLLQHAIARAVRLARLRREGATRVPDARDERPRRRCVPSRNTRRLRRDGCALPQRLRHQPQGRVRDAGRRRLPGVRAGPRSHHRLSHRHRARPRRRRERRRHARAARRHRRHDARCARRTPPCARASFTAARWRRATATAR